MYLILLYVPVCLCNHCVQSSSCSDTWAPGVYSPFHPIAKTTQALLGHLTSILLQPIAQAPNHDTDVVHPGVESRMSQTFKVSFVAKAVLIITLLQLKLIRQQQKCITTTFCKSSFW